MEFRMPIRREKGCQPSQARQNAHTSIKMVNFIPAFKQTIYHGCAPIKAVPLSQCLVDTATNYHTLVPISTYSAQAAVKLFLVELYANLVINWTQVKLAALYITAPKF